MHGRIHVLELIEVKRMSSKSKVLALTFLGDLCSFHDLSGIWPAALNVSGE